MLFLSFALMLIANYASDSNSQTNQTENASQDTRQSLKSEGAPSTANAAEVLRDSIKQKDVPVSFRRIDFRNVSYPTPSRKGAIHLKNGTYELADRKGIGGDTFELERVDYVDLTGAGDPEAIVDLLWVSCGGSCDGGSHLFYFYSIRLGKLKLLQRIGTGSLADECGLKSFVLKGRRLSLELFRTCQRQGFSFRQSNNGDDGGGKFKAHSVTRFIFEFNGRDFALRQREVFPNDQEDVQNFAPRISISND